MKIPIVLLCSLLILSCTKNTTLDSPSKILKSKNWYPYQTRFVKTNLTTNILERDTTYLVEECEQRSVYHFMPNNIVTRNLECFNKEVIEGTWNFIIDSVLFVHIIVPGYPPPSSGYNFPLEFGFRGRILEIDKDHFLILNSETFYTSPSTTEAEYDRLQYDRYTTYKPE